MHMKGVDEFLDKCGHEGKKRDGVVRFGLVGWFIGLQYHVDFSYFSYVRDLSTGQR